MPTSTEGLPTRKPGCHKEDRKGIKPEAILKLAQMNNGPRNEIERKVAVIKPCLQHEAYSQESLETRMDRFEYYDKGH